MERYGSIKPIRFFLMKAVFAVMPLLLFSPSAQADLYSWRDQDGVLNVTNYRDNIPPGVQVQVWKDSAPPPASRAPEAALNRSQTDIAPSPPAPVETAVAEARAATEGAFAVQLVEELGLAQNLSPQEAADLLTRIRVIPPLGRWNLDEPISPELVSRLRALTVSAAQRGAIAIQPEEALLAFDATAALLNVSVPVRSAPDLSEASSSSTLLDEPPLVLIAPPPPQIISAYAWVPVDQGFFWNGVPCSGFYVLNQRHGRRFVFLNRDRFEQRFIARINDPLFPVPLADPFNGARFPMFFVVPPRRPDHRGHTVPPASFLRHERHLRGGSARSFSTGRPTIQPAPPGAFTPLAPRQGFSISPMAPPLSMLPSVSPAPPGPHASRPSSHPRRSLRG